MFFDKLREKMIELRGAIDGRYKHERGAVLSLFRAFEDRTREKTAGLIGARKYRQFEGSLDAIQRAAVLKQIRADIGGALREILLVAGAGSLKDKLSAELDRLRIVVYREETARLAEIYADMLPDGASVEVKISQAEIEAVRGLPLAGLSTDDYIQKILIELYMSVIQATTNAFINAESFEGGIRTGLAEVSKKFETASKRAEKLASELIMLSSNSAIADVNKALSFEVAK